MGVSIKQKDRRELMTLAAVELLEQDGPNAMTVRKITAKIGGTSILVYQEFGSMSQLVSSVVEYGFQLMSKQLNERPSSTNILVDLWQAFSIVRNFSLAHRHLYTVMFAVHSVGGHQRSGEELDLGRETLRVFYLICKKAVDEGIFTTKPQDATQFFWTIIHGHLMLELAGYYTLAKEKPLASFSRLIATSMIGLGAQADFVYKTIQISDEPNLT